MSGGAMERIYDVRLMEARDLPDVLAIEKISFSNPWHETTFHGEIQNDIVSFPLVAVHKIEGKVIAYMIYWKIRDEAQINNIAVHPDYRRLGIAETLLRDVLAALRDDGVVFVSLEVRPSNHPARVLYEKLGFQIMGFRKEYYTNPAEDALVLGRHLQ
jgi:ribosomal-protein-alanine N-acetyltransferase